MANHTLRREEYEALVRDRRDLLRIRDSLDRLVSKNGIAFGDGTVRKDGISFGLGDETDTVLDLVFWNRIRDGVDT